MGRENADAVFARWVHLPDRSFRLLVYMALRSRDEHRPPQFWGGREELAYALGRIVPPEPAKNDSSARAEQFRKQRAADFEAVKVGLRVLTAADVIVLSRRAGGGLPACYNLHLGAGQGKGEPTPEGRVSLPLRKGEPTPGGRVSLPLAGGVGGETLLQTIDQPNPKKHQQSPLVSSSPANSAEKSGEQESELNRQVADLIAKYPEAKEAS